MLLLIQFTLHVCACGGTFSSKNVCLQMLDPNLFSDIVQIPQRHGDWKTQNN